MSEYELMKAKVAHCYGWTDRYISEMPYSRFIKYWLSITPIQAEKALLDMKVAAYPNMKKQDQTQLMNYLKRMTKTVVRAKSKALKSYSEVIDNLKASASGRR